MEEVRKNEAKVVGKTTQKVLPCSRCGTFEGVTITLAVPESEGGHPASEWNWHCLCPKCRAERATETLTGTSTLYPNGGQARRVREFVPEGPLPDPRRGPRVGPKGKYVEAFGIIFPTMTDAANYAKRSVATLTRWANNGTHGVRRIEA